MGPNAGLIEAAGKALATAECLPIFNEGVFADHMRKPTRTRPAEPLRRRRLLVNDLRRLLRLLRLIYTSN